MLSQGTTARYRALAHNPHSSGNAAANRRNTKAIGKHGEVVEKPLYEYSEELMYVAAWYHGTPGPQFTKFGE